MEFFKWRGTVKFRDDFDPAPVAERLHEAMDGLGTNEAEILQVLGNHCNKQRMEIAETYKVSYGEELIEALKSELGGNFERLCVALLMEPRHYDCMELHNAVSGLGTDETVLVQIMAMRTNTEIQEIKDIYREEYENELEDDLQCDTSGNFGRLMVSLCVGGRDSDDWEIDFDDDRECKVIEDAQKILDAGANAWGTDEQEINAILCQRAPGHLLRVIEKYEEISGHSIEDAIKDECSGGLEEGFLAIVEGVKSQPKYFARKLKKCFEGLGTEDHDLIRIIVSRSEVDLEDIKEYYQEMYGKSLEEAVDDECSGDYKRLLKEIIAMQD